MIKNKVNLIFNTLNNFSIFLSKSSEKFLFSYFTLSTFFSDKDKNLIIELIKTEINNEYNI